MTRQWMRLAAVLVAVGFLGWLAVSGSAEAATPAQDVGKCTVAGDKVASPGKVLLGETVQIQLTLDPDCPPAVLREADIVLVVDESLSMNDDNKLKAAKCFGCNVGAIGIKPDELDKLVCLGVATGELTMTKGRTDAE